jgi:hypothetical protein
MAPHNRFASWDKVSWTALQWTREHGKQQDPGISVHHFQTWSRPSRNNLHAYQFNHHVISIRIVTYDIYERNAIKFVLNLYYIRGHDVSAVTRLWTGWSNFDSRRRTTPLFATITRQTWGPPSLPSNGHPGYFLEGQAAGKCLSIHFQSSDDVKNSWIYTSNLPHICMTCCWVKHKEQLCHLKRHGGAAK